LTSGELKKLRRGDLEKYGIKCKPQNVRACENCSRVRYESISNDGRHILCFCDSKYCTRYWTGDGCTADLAEHCPEFQSNVLFKIKVIGG
jgi:hypothetical protein